MNETEHDELLVERNGDVAVVTMNREERMNAVGEVLHGRLVATWRELARDPSCRAIVITARGTKAFCVGMDLKENVERGGVREESRQASDVRSVGRTTPLRNGCLLPTVVAVNGVCTGAGLHFVADADVVIASEDAYFTDTHVSVGQVAALEPILLAARIGLGNALRLAMMGRHLRVSAHEAKEMSLVHEVVDPGALRARAIEVARLMGRNSPAAMRRTKLALWESVGAPPVDALQRGFDHVRAHWDHPDSREGPRAFVEQREPEWAPPSDEADASWPFGDGAT